MPDPLTILATALRTFTDERDWRQFHSPKNLATALSVEAAELVEEFQWLTEEESRELLPEKLARVRDEIGDVLIYLVRLADELGVDPLEAAEAKLAKNEAKYPADTVRGSAKKYDEYRGRLRAEDRGRAPFEKLRPRPVGGIAGEADLPGGKRSPQPLAP